MTVREVTPFGSMVRRYRRALGLTQEELAERAGLSERAIREMERGDKHVPRKETVGLLADALQLEGTEREAFEAAARTRASGTSLEERADSAIPPYADSIADPSVHARASIPAPRRRIALPTRHRARYLVMAAVLLAVLLGAGTLVVYRSSSSMAPRLSLGSKPVVRAVWGGTVPHTTFAPTTIAVAPTGSIYVPHTLPHGSAPAALDDAELAAGGRRLRECDSQLSER
jgi:transcriptional regulator with XRE-family HTH domain